MGVQTSPKPQPSPGRNKASGLEILSWGSGCRARPPPATLLLGAPPGAAGLWVPSGWPLLAPLVSILSLIPGGVVWCRRWVGIVFADGEGKGLEITFFGFFQKTFTHHQLPWCSASWPLGRRNRDTFWLPAGGARPQAEALGLAEGRCPAQAWVLVPSTPRAGGSSPCHLCRPPATPCCVGVGAARLLWDPEVCTLQRTGGEWRGGEGRGRRLAVLAPAALHSPAPGVCSQTADGADFSPRYPTGIFMLSVQP